MYGPGVVESVSEGVHFGSRETSSSTMLIPITRKLFEVLTSMEHEPICVIFSVKLIYYHGPFRILSSILKSNYVVESIIFIKRYASSKIF